MPGSDNKNPLASAIRTAVGWELRTIRESLGYSRRQLAALTGRGYQSVYSYERGERPLSLTVFVDLCIQLGVYAPDVLATALQRSRVDLSVVSLDPLTVLQDRGSAHPLRGWVSEMVGTVEGSTVVRLALSEVFTLARQLEVDPKHLLDYIVDLTPQPVSRRAGRRP